MGTDEPKLDVKKRKQIIFWIMQKRPDLDDLGLINLLYFLDFDWYEKTDEFLTGTTYRKAKYKISVPAFLPQKPDLKYLSKKEREFIEETFKRFSKKSSDEISKMSEKDIPYISASYGERLSYQSVFYRTDEFSVKDYSKVDETHTEKKQTQQR